MKGFVLNYTLSNVQCFILMHSCVKNRDAVSQRQREEEKKERRDLSPFFSFLLYHHYISIVSIRKTYLRPNGNYTGDRCGKGRTKKSFHFNSNFYRSISLLPPNFSSSLHRIVCIHLPPPISCCSSNNDQWQK